MVIPKFNNWLKLESVKEDDFIYLDKGNWDNQLKDEVKYDIEYFHDLLQEMIDDDICDMSISKSVLNFNFQSPDVISILNHKIKWYPGYFIRITMKHRRDISWSCDYLVDYLENIIKYLKRISSEFRTHADINRNVITITAIDTGSEIKKVKFNLTKKEILRRISSYDPLQMTKSLLSRNNIFKDIIVSKDSVRLSNNSDKSDEDFKKILNKICSSIVAKSK